MTFSRANPGGWTDSNTQITATQINQIDVDQSRAVDGNAGGTYANSGAIIIQGTLETEGTLNTEGTLEVESTLYLNGTGARIRYRGASQASGSATLSAQVDYRWIAALAANSTYTLATSTSPAPLTGNVVFLRAFPVGVGFTLTVGCETAGTLATLADSATHANGGWIQLIFNGTRWIVLNWHNFALQAAANNAA